MEIQAIINFVTLINDLDQLKSFYEWLEYEHSRERFHYEESQESEIFDVFAKNKARIVKSGF